MITTYIEDRAALFRLHYYIPHFSLSYRKFSRFVHLFVLNHAQYPDADENGAIAALDNMRANADVVALRDTYEADLVQLVGGFTDRCSVA